MDGLLPVKNQLDGLQKRVREIDRAIKEVLDSDEDMTRMHLTPSALSSHHKLYSKTMGTIAHRRFHPTLHSHTLNSPAVNTASTKKKQQHQEEDEDEQVLPAALSEQPLLPTPLYSTSDSDKMNLEMLLETYLHQINWVGSEIDLSLIHI